MWQTRARPAIKAAAYHFIASVAVGLIAALLVFGVWYPYPYRELSGGRELFQLVVMVDVICGPLLTAVLYNPLKPKKELFRDLGLVVVIQLLALLYGIYTVYTARPVWLVFEVDRFRAVSAADVNPADLHKALAPYQNLSVTGPKLIATRLAKDGPEVLRSINLSFQGLEPAVRPDWWVSFDEKRSSALERAKPVEQLRAKQPHAAELIDRAVANSGKSEVDLRWLPMTSFKTTNWVAFIDAKTADVLAYAPVDGF
jgi:hypothetical protein